jgi:hypothetical protein
VASRVYALKSSAEKFLKRKGIAKKEDISP